MKAKHGTIVEFELEGPTYSTAMIASDDSVWIAIQPKLFDLASWFWWWLCPRDKKAVVTLTVSDGVGGGVKVRSRAVRMATKFIRINGVPRGI